MITREDVDWDSVPRPGLMDYVHEEFTQYASAKSEGWVDPDDDFLIGDSGGFLMKMDFVFVDTYLFREASIFFEEEGVYTKFPEWSREWVDYWKTETLRRKFGHTANCKLYRKDIEQYERLKAVGDEIGSKKLLHPLTITGSHYAYLNYSRIMRTRNDIEKEEYTKAGFVGDIPKIEAFPTFWDGDYWMHKFDMFAANNSFNKVKGKARRKGYSSKESNDTANIINLIPKISVLHGAYDLDFLTEEGALTYMTKVNLDWYENHTYWSRNYISEQLDGIELGYKLSSEGNKSFGWRSKLISAGTIRNTSALVGKDAYRIKCEEAGKWPNLDEVLGVTMSTTESGATKSGNISIFGTGGTKGANWEVFERYFFNPKRIQAMPLENIFSYNGRDRVCGFFHPQIWCYEPYIDIDGNSDLEEAFIVDHINKLNAQSTLTTEEYVLYVGQRANTPEEAFSQSEQSMFTSPELIKHYEYLKRNEDEVFYVDGMYIPNGNSYKFMGISELKSRNITVGGYIGHYPHKAKENLAGCIRKFGEPFRVNGFIPDNLYEVTMDPVGIDKKKDKLTLKHSLVSITVRAVNNEVYRDKDLIMAHFIGRRDEREETDRIALSMCESWNAKLLVETDRGETVKNFTDWGKRKLLLTEPNIVWNTDVKYRASTKLGMVIGDSKRKLQGLELLYEWLYRIRKVDEDGKEIRNYHTIKSVRIISELLRHNAVGNFDSISDLILAAFSEKRNELSKRKLGKNIKRKRNLAEELNRISTNPFKRKFYVNR